MNEHYMLQPLTDSQEILLAKHHDGECSVFERFLVRRLLKQHPGAIAYLDSLKTTQSAVRTALPIENPNLWTRISVRMHAEERSAVMLGKRQLPKESSPFTFPMWKTASAGVAAALVVMAVMPSKQQPVEIASFAGQSLQAARQFIPDVNFVGSMAGKSVGSVSRRVPNAVEVDWMRSDGRLRVMNEAEDRAPIIWVKRRAQRNNMILRQEPSSNGVVMVEPRTPRGIAVSSK